jgi:hypothetical protein
MTWGAIGGAAIATVGGALLGGDKGGGGTTTQSKEPWAPAQPWLTANLQTGQNLQNYYQDNPFNTIQQASYGNLLQGNDYINQMVPGLLSQFSQSGGFDRSNPRARPQAYAFPAMQGGYQPTAGLLGASSGQMNTQANPWALSSMAALRAGAPAAPQLPLGSLPFDGYSLGDGSPGGL